MLYTKPIKEITFQDVLDFCNNNYPESFVLDYKKDFPTDNEALAKTIAAFANTYGGILILGVNAPKGFPIPPFEGITYNPSLKYEEKIENIVLSHIHEPIIPLPEIQVCKPEGGKTFVAIRVQESQHTPHRVGGDKDIYIRTGQSSSPHDEDKATWEKIEWLASRRKKSIDLREYLINEGETYCIEAFKNRSAEINQKSAVLTLRILPLFPHNPLFDCRNIINIMDKSKIYHNYNQVFPPIPLDPIQPIQNGFHELTLQEKGAEFIGEQFNYIHVNSFGLYLYKEDIRIPQRLRSEKGEDLSYFRILKLLQCFLHSTVKFYKEVGYYGALFFTVELSNALGLEIKHPALSYGSGFSNPSLNISKISRSYLKWEKTFTEKVLETNLNTIISELMTNISWSLGLGVNETILKKAISQYITE